METDDAAELDQILTTVRNHEIYERITANDVFDPLEFFRLYIPLAEYVSTNRNTAVTVNQYLSNLDLSDDKRRIVYGELFIRFDKPEIGKGLKTICTFLQRWMQTNEPDTVTISRKAAIKALEDADARKALEAEVKAKNKAIADLKQLLKEMRTEFVYASGRVTVLEENALRQSNTLSDDNDRAFAILKELLATMRMWFDSVSGQVTVLEENAVTGTKDEYDPAERDELIGKPRLTVDQFIMVMFAIGGSRLKGLDKKKVAEGLSALTGDSVDHIANRFGQVLPKDDGIQKFNSKPDVYNRDVEKVCHILTTMGLTDEASKLKQSSGV